MCDNKQIVITTKGIVHSFTFYVSRSVVGVWIGSSHFVCVFVGRKGNGPFVVVVVMDDPKRKIRNNSSGGGGTGGTTTTTTTAVVTGAAPP